MGIASLFSGRNSHRIDVVVVGDSLTAGLFASTYSAIWTQRLNALIRAAFPTTSNGSGGGMGWLPISDVGATANIFPSWPVNDTTGSGAIDLGPVRGCDAWTGGGDITYTAPAGTTSVKITYYDAFPAGEVAYSVSGGGASGTLSNTQALVDRLSPSIPMSGGEVLTITLSSGVFAPTGIMHFAGDENSGITFHACGRAGWCAGTESGIGWNAPEDQGPDLNWAQAFVNAFPNTLAFAVLLGSNDGSTSAGNRTAAQFQSDLEALITTIRGSDAVLASAPLLIIGAWEGQFTWADGGGWPAYGAAMAAVAAWDGNAQFINLANYMPSAYTTPFPSIYYTGGGGHPNDTGERVVAQTIFHAITDGSLQMAGII